MQVRQILSRILLGLLGDEQSDVEIVDTQSCVIELVDIGQEADVLDCLFEAFFVAFRSEVRDQTNAGFEIWRVLADVGCDDVL